MRLRAATNEDDESCFRLNEASMRGYVEPIHGWDPEVQRSHHSEWFDPGRLSIIEDDSGNPIGVLDVTDEGDHLTLSRIALLPEVQGRGVGSAVMRDLLRRGRTVRLQVFVNNIRARRFYERLGFTVDGYANSNHLSMHHPGGAMTETGPLRSYLRESWIDRRLELGPSPIHGIGVIARRPIGIGEVVIVWGGVVMTEADIDSGRAKPRTAAEIGEGVFLAGEHGDPDSIDDFLNHSCDSHLWFEDEVTLSTRRAIDAGDEVTVDYALWGTDTEFPCICGSPSCRGELRAGDWRGEDVRARYDGHFQPYINARLDRLA